MPSETVPLDIDAEPWQNTPPSYAFEEVEEVASSRCQPNKLFASGSYFPQEQLSGIASSEKNNLQWQELPPPGRR
jgi:hypothetical protein